MASTSIVALRTAKRQLRRSMAQTLSAIHSEEIAEQSQKVAEQVLKSQTYARARSISVYIHMDTGEVITDQICRSILKAGKKLYVPLFASPCQPATATGPTVSAAPVDVKTEFATDMVMVRLRDVEEYEGMISNRWGIREPPLTYADGTIREEGE
uniref:5-formyltetrahydrofolate cyclo-ligase n=1 Tax=Melanopsichium pennsylvanicum 4 TaxID=1398559 RepID=A0A077RAC9_9BASI|nr:related to 5-formyltetrahydrofolate cyclo-ligase [Melanopsichium pennsylvanicum 4]